MCIWCLLFCGLGPERLVEQGLDIFKSYLEIIRVDSFPLLPSFISSFFLPSYSSHILILIILHHYPSSSSFLSIILILLSLLLILVLSFILFLLLCFILILRPPFILILLPSFILILHLYPSNTSSSSFLSFILILYPHPFYPSYSLFIPILLIFHTHPSHPSYSSFFANFIHILLPSLILVFHPSLIIFNTLSHFSLESYSLIIMILFSCVLLLSILLIY